MDRRRCGARIGVMALAWASCLLALAACSSTELPGTGGRSGKGGATAPGGSTGSGGNAGIGGDTGAAGSGGMMCEPAINLLHPGSCCGDQDNPDFNSGGACAPDCQTVACSSSQGRACSQDCCVTCGIDQWATKICSCPVPGLPYANCTCVQPSFIPFGLHGGPCVPQGDSRPAVQVANSLRFVPCSTLNLVCFTADSTPSAERGCICRDDGIGNGGMGPGLFLHCGSVNHWFTNDGVPVVF